MVFEVPQRHAHWVQNVQDASGTINWLKSVFFGSSVIHSSHRTTPSLITQTGKLALSKTNSSGFTRLCPRWLLTILWHMWLLCLSLFSFWWSWPSLSGECTFVFRIARKQIVNLDHSPLKMLCQLNKIWWLLTKLLSQLKHSVVSLTRAYNYLQRRKNHSKSQKKRKSS